MPAEKEAYTIKDDVPANTSFDGRTQTHTVPADGTLLDPQLRIYPGPENDLHLKITVKQDRTGRQREIISTEGPNDYIDGEDDFWRWHSEIPVYHNDVITVDPENVDGQHSHNYRFSYSIDFAGGSERAAPTLFERWF